MRVSMQFMGTLSDDDNNGLVSSELYSATSLQFKPRRGTVQFPVLRRPVGGTVFGHGGC